MVRLNQPGASNYDELIKFLENEIATCKEMRQRMDGPSGMDAAGKAQINNYVMMRNIIVELQSINESDDELEFDFENLVKPEGE